MIDTSKVLLPLPKGPWISSTGGWARQSKHLGFWRKPRDSSAQRSSLCRVEMVCDDCGLRIGAQLNRPCGCTALCCLGWRCVALSGLPSTANGRAACSIGGLHRHSLCVRVGKQAGERA